MWLLRFVGGSPCRFGGGEVDDGLLDEKICRVEHEAHVRADLLHVLHVEKQADGEPLVDEHVAK